MLKISSILDNSIGQELGLEVGDQIVAFDGHSVVDILDYLYYDKCQNFTMTVKDGKREHTFEIEKDEEETLGLTFSCDGLDIKLCHNNCLFCFVAQMPKGMRDSLYVKDDDYRQSFLYGNFVTLTNCTQQDIDRICRLHLSPLYVSVHTTDGELRKRLLRNKNADKICDYLKKFEEYQIEVNAQIVLCRGINDGESLMRSIDDLYAVKSVKNVAVVPCGMTKFRDGLTQIEDIDSEYAKELIKVIREKNKQLNNFVCLADEFYFKAGLEVEPYEFYGDFPQIENGVGLTAKFKKEILDSITKSKNDLKPLIISGTSASRFINQMAKQVQKYCENLEYSVLAVKNEFFGETVNCTGLLTGTDIINAVKQSNIDYDYIVLPCSMLKNGEDVFLDGVTIKELSSKLKKVIVTDGSGESFVKAISKPFGEDYE